MPISYSSSLLDTSSSRHHTYSRKQKSLGLLCTNFLSIYNHEHTEVIGLDDAASQLGVERRRIYDIVNVLESVGVLVRKAKNQYTWKGFKAIPGALKELKEDGLKDTFHNFSVNFAKGSDEEDDDDEGSSNPNTGSQNENSKFCSLVNSSASSRIDNRREKSLGLLTQNFVKLFICSDVEMISLEEAAKSLLGGAHNTSIMRTKVRRLYDIANVLSSMSLIEKTHTLENRKPAFKWLGYSNKPKTASCDSLVFHNSGKRAFGTDLTNICPKRNKVASLIDESMSADSKTWKQIKTECVIDKSSSGQETNNYHFGPFAPKVGVEETKRVVDWENLSLTYRPQYQNQALKDLFYHYKDAWNSWYSVVAGENPSPSIK